MIDQFTYKDFIPLLKSAVEYFPKQDLKCKRLNGFVILNKKEDLNADNFGKNKNQKDEYFVRGKEKFPLLAVWPTTSPSKNLFSNCTEQAMSFEIAVLDELKEDCKNCGYCGKRSSEDVFCDTSDLLMWIMAYLRSVVCIEVDGEYKWVSSAQLTSIPTYIEHDRLSRKLQKFLRQKNETVQGYRWFNKSRYGAYGNFCILNITFWGCLPEIELNVTEFSQKECCD